MKTIKEHLETSIETNFDRFLTTRFNSEAVSQDIIIHPRTILGDYDGLAIKLARYENLQHGKHQEYIISTLQKALHSTMLTPLEATAAQQILWDMKKTEHLDSVLYLEHPFFSFEGYINRWHHDDGMSKTPQFLCAYNVLATELLDKLDAIPIDDCFYDQKENAIIHELTLGNFSAHARGAKNGPVHRRPDTSKQIIPRWILAA